MLVFEERGNWSTQRKTSRSREKTNNKRGLHMMPGPGMEPGTHWWEASSLTTVPSLLATVPLLNVCEVISGDSVVSS